MKHSRASSDDEGVEGSLRRCIVTGDVQSPERMIRFVVGPDNAVVPDVAHKLPGRGFWVGAQRALLVRACERDRFLKAARAKVNVPENLADLVEALLVKRLVSLKGLGQWKLKVA